MKKLYFILFAGILLAGCNTEQDPNPARLELSESTINIDDAGGESTIELTHNFAWEAAISPGAESWLSLEPGETSGGATYITITALINNTESEREATISFSSKGLVKTLTIIQEAVEIEVALSSLLFEAAGGTQFLTVTTIASNWNVEVTSGGDWCSVQKQGTDLIAVTTTANGLEEKRSAAITVSAGKSTAEVVVTQEASRSYADKEVIRLQTATKGNGVDLIFMGEGYTASDMISGTGKYVKDMLTGMEHFFSVYPYSAYREYFNVWMVVAVSNEAGLSSINPKKDVDTVFDCVWLGGNSTGLLFKDPNGNGITDNGEEDAVLYYAELAAKKAGKPMSEMTVIIPINANIYAGTCHMLFVDHPETTGFSVSFCPVGSFFKEIVVHEVGGHGFGKLMDEYLYYSGTIPNYHKSQFQSAKKELGWYINIDFSSNILNTTWAAFAGQPGYKMVSTFEGAYYPKGVWRPEYNSCMNNNVFYFNAPSRYAQMERIFEWSGVTDDYTFEQFFKDDIIPPYPDTRGDGVLEPFVPLGLPVIGSFDLM